jgi:hypothetical protein
VPDAAAGFSSTAVLPTLKEACARAGFSSDGAELLRLGENAIYQLAADPVVVRIARSADRLARVQRELCVARWLAASKVPAVCVFDEIDQPMVVHRHPVTFWHTVTGGDPAPTHIDLARLLAAFHKAPDCPCELASFDPLRTSQSRLASAGTVPWTTAISSRRAATICTTSCSTWSSRCRAGRSTATRTPTAAFWHLVETDDRLLTTQPVMDLMIYIGNDDPLRIQPVIERMLGSEYPAVKEAGGKQAAFAGLEFGLDGLLSAAPQNPDGSVRKGAAEVCARRLGGTADPVGAAAALSQFFTDDDEDVRKSAAQAALTLRGQALRPFADLLSTLIQSPSFTDALSAVLMTLEQATDRIDDLVIDCAKRFLQEHGSQVGDLSTAAAGQAQGVGRPDPAGLCPGHYASRPSPRS